MFSPGTVEGIELMAVGEEATTGFEVDNSISDGEVTRSDFIKDCVVVSV